MKVRLKHERLARAVAQSKLTQNRWAQKLGLGRGHFSQLINGRRPYPNPETRRKLIQGFGLPFDDLFEVESPGRRPSVRDASAETANSEKPLVHRRCLAANRRPADWNRKEQVMRNAIQDARCAMRHLVRAPMLSIVTVLVLALGIGANAAIYSLVRGVLLQPLAFPQPDRLMRVWETEIRTGDDRDWVSPANFVDWKAQSNQFSLLTFFTTGSSVLAADDADPERLRAASVGQDFFETLGVAPSRGRSFDSEDYRPGSDVVILGQGFWKTRFAGDPAVVGKKVVMDGRTTTIVGVAPEELDFPENVDLFVPHVFDFDVSTSRGAHYLQALARLAPGATQPSAQAEMDQIAEALQTYPQNQDRGIAIAPLQDAIVGSSRRPLFLLQGAVVFLLLVACTTIANMLMVRAAERRREMGLRLALGAKRQRILRQLLTESLLLALLGGVIGVVAAYGSLRALLAAIPQELPRIANVALDAPILLVMLGASLLTGLLFGILPARDASRTDLQESLRIHSAGQSKGHLRLKSVLVIVQVALCVTLLFGAGAFIHSFLRLNAVDPGFAPDNLLTLRVQLPEARYPKERVAEFFQRLEQRSQSDPRVLEAAATAWVPLGGTWFFSFEIDGRPRLGPGRTPSGSFRPVSPNYLRTMRIPLRKGRFLTQHDDQGAPLVIVINETLARRYFPDEDPLGKRLQIGYGREEPPWREIVGVAADIKQFGLASGEPPAFYLPYRQVPFNTMSLMVRTRDHPDAAAGAIRTIVREIDPELAVFGIETIEQRLRGSLAPRRFITALTSIFAAAALLLACLGIYGVLAHTVVRRTTEIGLRMALGAKRANVFAIVMGQGTRLISVGLLLGGAGAWGAGRAISSLLFEIGPGDPVTILSVGAVLVVSGLLACYIPARRATAIDPMRALKYE